MHGRYGPVLHLFYCSYFKTAYTCLRIKLNHIRITDYFSLIIRAIKGEQQDYTTGSMRRAVFMLAIPMILEMMMESVFAVVDLYFVGHLPDSNHAISTVGLTESVLTIIYSLAIGVSMAATAMVARRIGEKDPDAAAKAGIQALWVAIFITLIDQHTGLYFRR